jgi:hypothetical protein
MDDRYPDFWAESNWPRRPRRDPFRMRLLALLVAGALLTPIALLMRRNDGEVVTTGRLPGAAVALEPVLSGGRATTTAAPSLLPSPETVTGTLPPVVGATAAAAATASADAAGAGTLPLAVGTLPAAIAAPAAPAAPGRSSDDSGSSSSGSGSSDSDSSSSSGATQAPAARPTPAPAPAPAAPSRPATTAAPTPKPTPAPAPPPVQYTSEQVEALIRQVFPDDQEEKALAVAWRESHHDPRAYNGWCCYGLFQIYFEVNAKFLATLGITSAEQLFDPVLNTTAAFAMFRRSGWQPWGG